MNEQQANGPEPQAQEAPTLPSKAPPPSLSLVTAKLTDVGQSRPHNEDYVEFYTPPDPKQLARKGSIYLVADGMGGHQAGEVASQGAVELVIGQYYSDTTHDIGTSLVRAFRVANQQIHTQSQTDPSKSGMGTTLVAAVILDRKVYIANVGDSRAYLINSRGITQITEDHSWVEEQVRAGLLTPEQARKHPQRNLVTRALGSKPSVEVDLFEGELNAGDRLLLCSDGLTGRVGDQELAAFVREHSPQEAAKRLVALANERGGNDNITVLVVSAQDEPATVKAPVMAPVKKETESRSLLVPILSGAAVILVFVLGGLLAWWLFLRGEEPSPTPTATLIPPTVTTAPDTAVPPTETVAPIVTDTPSLVESNTPEPTSTLAETPAVTDTPEPPTATNTPSATDTPTYTPTPDYPPPTLLRPEERDAGSLQGDVTFEWAYTRPLGENEYYQVLIWPEGDTNHDQGAAQLWKLTSQTINLDSLLTDVRKTGPGDYYWSVVIKEKIGDSERRLSPEATPAWKFTYIGPESSSAPGSTGSPGQTAAPAGKTAEPAPVKTSVSP